MKRHFVILFFVFFFSLGICCQNTESNTLVSFKTNYGEIKIELYPETVKHRSNFIKLVKSGYYDGVLFHRVIENFMIQAGDAESKKARPNQLLGTGDVGYTVPAEIIYPNYYHKHGALAAARQGDNVNPKKASSGAQFYIVTGRIYSEGELKAIENSFFRKEKTKLFNKMCLNKQKEFKKLQLAKNDEKLAALRDSIYSEVDIEMAVNVKKFFSNQQYIDYSTIGGAHHLDGEYTVFGEVIEGLEIVDKISRAKTGVNDRPVNDIRILKATVL